MGILDIPPGARPGNYPTLGFDPAPGAPAVLDSTSEQVSRVASNLEHIHEALESVATVGGIWEGVAAEAFVEAMDELPDKARELSDALNQASGLLTGWEASLEDYQRRAMDLEARAAAAKAELDQARSDPALDLAGQFFPGDESLREAQARYEAAVQDVRTWEGRLEDIVGQAMRLLTTHQDEAGRIADQLDELIESEGGGGLLGAVSGLVSGAFDLVSGFAGAVTDFIAEHGADILANVGDAFGALSTALGAAALAVGAVGLIIPPLAPVAFPVAGVLTAGSITTSAVALGAHGAAKLAGADVDWTTIGLDLAGAASGGIGRIGIPIATASYDAFVVGGGIGNSGGIDGVIDDLETYWLPDSPGEAVLTATLPGSQVVWNAFEEEMQE